VDQSHAWIHIDVKKPDGNLEEWMIEFGTPNTLLRRGFTRDPEARNGNYPWTAISQGQRLACEWPRRHAADGKSSLPVRPWPTLRIKIRASNPVIHRTAALDISQWGCPGLFAGPGGLDRPAPKGKVRTPIGRTPVLAFPGRNLQHVAPRIELHICVLFHSPLSHFGLALLVGANAIVDYASSVLPPTCHCALKRSFPSCGWGSR